MHCTSKALGFKALLPLDTVRAVWWFRQNISEPSKLRPFSDASYPHIGAPGGPADALDDPLCKEIWLQWGSRLGKTFFGQCACLFAAARNPTPMLFTSSSQKLATEIIARTYRILENCPPLRDQLLNARFRKQDFVHLDNCRMFVGWARSIHTLADKGVQIGHANEIDKWLYVSTSQEADPLKLFDDRFKEFSYYKRIKEGTPTLKMDSRIERGRLSSNDCKYFVPCPKCGRYQVLYFGSRDDDFGVRWEKPPGGKSDGSLAASSAYYLCVEGCKLFDEHRAPMIRNGVWVPDGCEVDPDGAKLAIKAWREDNPTVLWQGWEKAEWVTGAPHKDGSVNGSQLSSLYALSREWGEIASEFLKCNDREGDRRNFVNQWLAETWQPFRRSKTWEEIADKCASDVPQLIIPEGHELLTCGVDKQTDHFVYVIDAWGPNRVSHTIDYGVCGDLSFLAALLFTEFEYANPRPGKKIDMMLLDTGFRPKDTAEFCQQYQPTGRFLACKGSPSKLPGPFRMHQQGKQSALPGIRLVLVDSQETQDWLDAQIYSLQRSDQGSHTVFSAPRESHQDYFEQLLNDVPVSSLDTSNNVRENWVRWDKKNPNDYRDCRRYAYAAMWVLTRGRPIGQRRRRIINHSALKMPDGRAYLSGR